MASKILKCTEPQCGADFAFTDGEQAFYAEKGFTEPKRCPTCRQARKANRTQEKQVAPAAKTEFINSQPDEQVRRNRRGGNQRRKNFLYDE